MAQDTAIEWADATFNPWRGCQKISPGCKLCYASTLVNRWGGDFAHKRIVAAEAYWRQPIKWDREALRATSGGKRPRVFCASLADVFESWDGPMLDAKGGRIAKCSGREGWHVVDKETVDRSIDVTWLTMQDVRNRLFALIDATPNLDYLLLTKRPENVLRMTYDAWCKKVPGHVSQNEGDGRRWAWPRNVWLGVSVEDQALADERIPLLLKTPAAVRFLSVEPLLGPVDLSRCLHLGRCKSRGGSDAHGGDFRCGLPEGHKGHPHSALTPTGSPWFGGPPIDWLIVGGESGHGARPCNIAWIRSIVQQCQAAGVPAFVKQLGGHVVVSGKPPFRQGHIQTVEGRVFLVDKKGGDISEFPEDLRVRHFPHQETPHAS